MALAKARDLVAVRRRSTGAAYRACCSAAASSAATPRRARPWPVRASRCGTCTRAGRRGAGTWPRSYTRGTHLQHRGAERAAGGQPDADPGALRRRLRAGRVPPLAAQRLSRSRPSCAGRRFNTASRYADLGPGLTPPPRPTETGAGPSAPTSSSRLAWWSRPTCSASARPATPTASTSAWAGASDALRAPRSDHPGGPGARADDGLRGGLSERRAGGAADVSRCRSLRRARSSTSTRRRCSGSRRRASAPARRTGRCGWRGRARRRSATWWSTR